LGQRGVGILDASTVGSKIAGLRKAQGMTQQQLADELSVTNKAVSKWETGGGLPDIAMLPILATALGVSVDELISDSPIVEGEADNEAAPGKFHNIRRYIRKPAVIALIAAALVISITAGIIINQTRYVVLTIADSSIEATHIHAALHVLDIPARIRDNAIFVPKNRLNEITELLAFQDLVNLSASRNLSVLDSAEGFAVTGETAKSLYEIQIAEAIRMQILSIPEVDDVLVLVSLSERSPFRTSIDRGDTRASVLLTLSNGAELQDQTVQSIAMVIRDNVTEIENENITITDSNMNYYTIN